jgi:hypothetical protein
VTRSGVAALVKEAMSMRSSGHLLRRAGREFVKNLIWLAVVIGVPAVILAAVTDLYLVGVSAFVGASVTVLAALVTVGALWSGASDETPNQPPPGSHDQPYRPPASEYPSDPGSGWGA